MAGYEKPRQRVNNSAELYSRMMARRAMYGGGGGAGGLESGIEGFGSDIGRGIYQAITRGKENAAANAEMQQYNDINPPRADLISVPGESVDAWSRQHPNIPTEQSTIPAPYGQGALAMQPWLHMQQQQRAQDIAQQQAAIRGMQMAGMQQRMQLGNLSMAQKYQALQNAQNSPKLPPGANADINKIAAANAMAKQYTGLTLEDVTKNPQDWHLSEDKTFVTNDVLSKYYNRQIAVPPDVWTKAAPQMMAAGAILQRYRNTPLGPEIDKQLGLSRGGQPNISEPQGEQPMQPATAEQVGTPPQVQRSQISGGIPQTPTSQQVLPPSANMQSDYFRQNPQGATPMTPNPDSTGAPPVAGQTGKQQSPADEYILRAIGGAGGQ